MPRRIIKKTAPSPKVKAFKQGVSNLKQGATNFLKKIDKMVQHSNRAKRGRRLMK